MGLLKNIIFLNGGKVKTQNIKIGGTYKQMKLYHEDCIKVLQSMPNESVDLVVTDPPYLMDFVSHRRKDLYAPIVGDNLGGGQS